MMTIEEYAVDLVAEGAESLAEDDPAAFLAWFRSIAS